MAKDGMEIQGMAAFEKSLKSLPKQAKTQSVIALEKAALFVKAEAVKRTPIDTGALRASAKIRVDSTSQKKPFAEIYYTAAYAIFVHEIQKNYTVGEWKYLERAINENKQKIRKILGRSFKFRIA